MTQQTNKTLEAQETKRSEEFISSQEVELNDIGIQSFLPSTGNSFQPRRASSLPFYSHSPTDIEQECISLKLKLANVQTENDHLRQNMQNCQKECEFLRFQNENLLNAKEAIECRADEQKKVISHMKRNAKKSSQDRARLHTSVESYKELSVAMSRRNIVLEEDLSRLKEERDNFMSTIVSLRSELHNVSQELQSLQSKDQIHTRYEEDAIVLASSKFRLLQRKKEKHEYDVNQKRRVVQERKLLLERNHDVQNLRKVMENWSMVSFGRRITVLDHFIEDQIIEDEAAPELVLEGE